MKFLALIFMTLTVLASAVQAEEYKSAYDRVMKTQTIRCGYLLYPPMLMKDPNTGEMTGIAADVINTVAESLKLKVEWTSEFGFATSVADLEAGRFDATCIGFWRLPAEAPRLAYTMPFAYSHMNAYVRADDTRFDKDVNLINDPKVRIVSTDGQSTSAVARDDFPNAKLTELPNMTSITQQIEEVVAGKADVFMCESGSAEDYMKKNPGKIKRVPSPTPIRVYQNTFSMKIGEQELKTMLDSALINLVENGGMDKILKKYDADGKIFKKVAKGYQN